LSLFVPESGLASDMSTVSRPRTPASFVLLVLLLVVVAGSVAVALASRLPACQFTPASQCTRVLFIGNSYVFVNDLPGTFARLAGSGGHAVETSMIAPGGAFLADEAADPSVAAAIAGTPWAAVVLQEQSQRPASTAERDAFVGAVNRLAAMAVDDNARPLLLETWAHRDGWPELHMDYTAMQRAINDGYAQAAAQTGARVIPAGEGWQRAVAAGLPLALWQDDGSHPAPAGTYLAACAVYQSIFGESPVGLSDHEGLPDDVAARLQAIAAGG
jgi:hypothetical protein